MKIVDVANCSPKEVAEHAGGSPVYSFNIKHLNSSTPSLFSVKQNYRGQSLNLRGADSLLYLKNQPKIKRSSTIKFLKSSFWVSSYLSAVNCQYSPKSEHDRQTNRQTDRQTDKQTDRQDDYYNPSRTCTLSNKYLVCIEECLTWFIERYIYYRICILLAVMIAKWRDVLRKW